MTFDADVAVIYGTRPEVIKLAPVVKALRKGTRHTVLTVSTHQHSSLLEDSLAASHLVTDVETRRPDASSVQSLVSTIGVNLQELDLANRAVVVQGDTVTAYAGALFAFLNQMTVIHVEAGLRTFNLRNPFPEEGLRRAIAQLTDLHLAPTDRARANLEGEGINPSSIVVTGNTSIDALLGQLEAPSRPLDTGIGIDGPYCVVTLHRRESWGDPIARVATAIGVLADKFPSVYFVCPLHPNPVVRTHFEDITSRPNVRIIDSLPHDEFVNLLRGSTIIITDSGGIQEESTVLGIPTLVAREETERPEAVDAGVTHMVGTDADSIIAIASRILNSEADKEALVSARETFGDGRAGDRCALAIRALLDNAPLPGDMVSV